MLMIVVVVGMAATMLNLAPCHFDTGIYRPRNPQANGCFRCAQDHFEQLEMHGQDRYASRYGFWRPKTYSLKRLI